MNQSELILKLLSPYIDAPVECDGMTNIASSILTAHGIAHAPMMGAMKFNEDAIYPHCWIQLPTGEIIDFRARLWLGEKTEIPHGIFTIDQYPGIYYNGEPFKVTPLHPVVIQTMMMRVNVEMFRGI